MANSKIFRKAQERSPGLGSSKDGYFNFESAIKNIKKSQIKKCEPYSFLKDVSKRINVRASEMYIKILFTNVYGVIKILVSSGKNKDQAVSSKSWMIIGNVLENKVQTISIIDKKASEKTTSSKNKLTKNVSSSKLTPNRNSIKRSRRFSKRTRTVSRRSRLKRANRPPVKNQIEVKDFQEFGMPQATSFNSVAHSMPAKDFASIFEDSNNRLYDDESQNEIKIENPPGVAKFIGMGVDSDRPSVLVSTQLSPVITDKSLDVYDQVLMDRKFRIETVFNNLEKVDEEDIESLLETLQEFKLLTSDAVQVTAVISQLDDQLVSEISTEMTDLATVLGFSTSYKNSQLYAQVISDLSVAAWLGTYDTTRGPRHLSIKQEEINYDSAYNYFRFNGTDIYNNTLIFDGKRTSSSDPQAFTFGNVGTFIGFYDSVNPTAFKNNFSLNLGRSSTKLLSYTNKSPMLMQAIYFELMMSRLIDNNDSIALAVKKHGHKKIASAFLGVFKDPTVALNEIRVPEKLAAIIKYQSGGENYYPLEQFLSTASGIKGRTFLDAVIQPAVGSIIEDEDANFDLLNSWVESSATSLESYFKYIDAAMLEGGSAIVLNEIILAFIKCISDPNAKIGSRKHPHSNRMELKNDDLESSEIANILNRGMSYFAAASSSGLGHTYNTMGYSFFEGQGALAERLSRYSGYGLYDSGIVANLREYNINSGDWNKNTSRSPGDGEASSEVLNNIYEEFSRFFQILENNLMTSIDLLLSDLGLLTLSQAPDYNTSASGYFDIKPGVVKRPDLLKPTEAAQLGTYEATKFSGMPRIYLRNLLAKCCQGVLYHEGNPGWLSDSENIVKAAKVAVENLDENLGPTRYKVTHGQWPLDSQDYNGLSSSIYEALVPAEVKEAREGNIEVDVDTDSDGNIESINVGDASAGWEFIDSVDGFCPLTLMLDGEDNSSDNTSLVRGNRALFDNFYDKLTGYRTTVYKMKSFLQKPIFAYQKFPENLEESVGTISLDSLKSLAQLPGIDGQELVKFTSEIQINNLRKALETEVPAETLRYLPNRYIISDNEFRVAKSFVDSYLDGFSDDSKAVIQTIGLPTGLLSAQKLGNEIFSITREAEYMFFSSYNWSSKKNLFHPSIYLLAGSFTNCDPNSSFGKIVENAKYFISNKSVSSFVSYSDAKEILGISDIDAIQIFTNHCLDHALRLTLKITTGMELSEDTFRINSESNNLFVSSDGQKNIEPLLTTLPESFESIFKDNGIITPKEIIKTLSESTSLEINTYLGSLECRLISPEEIPKKVLSPRMFDRVLSLICHPDEHYTLRSGSGLKRSEKTIDGVTRNIYQIDLKEAGANSVKNDHFASYYYRIEEK